MLNYYFPISPDEEVILEGEYKILEAHPDGFSCNTDGLPSSLDKVKILLQYRNSQGTKFYTLYDPRFKSNNYMRSKPMEFSC